MLPRFGKSMRRPDGVAHSSVSNGPSNSETFSTRLAASLITSSGCIDRTGMVLQRAYRLDEPAVVRAGPCSSVRAD